MLISTIILGILAVAILIIAYLRGNELPVQGLKAGGSMFIQILPILLFALIIAGTLPLIVPREAIDSFIGAESGWRGILTGTFVGSLLPGGPYISFPIAAGFMRMGASIGTLVALVTAWSIIAILRLPLDVGFLGWKFTLIRLGCTFFIVPIAGFIAEKLFSNVDIL